MLFWHLLIFFKLNFFEKFFQEYHHSVKQLRSRSGSTFQTGSKLFANVTLVDKEPTESINFCQNPSTVTTYRDQTRERLGQNSRPRGQNFALNGTQGEVGVSLKKKKKKILFFFFLGDSFSFCHHTNASCGDIIRQSTTTASCFSFH